MRPRRDGDSALFDDVLASWRMASERDREAFVAALVRYAIFNGDARMRWLSAVRTRPPFDRAVPALMLMAADLTRLRGP